MGSGRGKRPREARRSLRGDGPKGASGSRPERRALAAAGDRQSNPARLATLGRLTGRADYVRVQGGRSLQTRGFVLKARPRAGQREEAANEARFGFTVTKRLGKATARNRARRRLKEAVRLVAGRHARGGFDYVLIGRQGALRGAFADLVEDLRKALYRIHDEPQERRARA